MMGSSHACCGGAAIAWFNIFIKINARGYTAPDDVRVPSPPRRLKAISLPALRRPLNPIYPRPLLRGAVLAYARPFVPRRVCVCVCPRLAAKRCVWCTPPRFRYQNTKRHVPHCSRQKELGHLRPWPRVRRGLAACKTRPRPGHGPTAGRPARRVPACRAALFRCAAQLGPLVCDVLARAAQAVQRWMELLHAGLRRVHRRPGQVLVSAGRGGHGRNAAALRGDRRAAEAGPARDASGVAAEQEWPQPDGRAAVHQEQVRPADRGRDRARLSAAVAADLPAAARDVTGEKSLARCTPARRQRRAHRPNDGSD